MLRRVIHAHDWGVAADVRIHAVNQAYKAAIPNTGFDAALRLPARGSLRHEHQVVGMLADIEGIGGTLVSDSRRKYWDNGTVGKVVDYA